MGYLDHLNAVPLLIFGQPGANALATEHSVRTTMRALAKDFPPGIGYKIVYDPTEFIQQSVNEVIRTILVAILLVVAVVILFLQTWRASLIPVVAIPVSLIGAFTVLAAFGFSLNNLSLFGLVLAVGIVVDDAIVVVENVERNIAAGLSPREAAHRTMDEVGGALDRDRAHAVRGVRADRVHLRDLRAVLPPVRGHHRRLDADLLRGVADAEPGAVRAAVPAARHPRTGQPRAGGARPAGLLSRVQPRLRGAVGRLRPPHHAAGAGAGRGAAGLCRADRAHRVPVRGHPHRLHPGAGPGLRHHRAAAAARRLAGPLRPRAAAGGGHHAAHPGRGARGAVHRPRRHHLHRRLQLGDRVRRVRPVRAARRPGPQRRPSSSASCGSGWPPCRGPSCSPSRRRRCRASAAPAASR